MEAKCPSCSYENKIFIQLKEPYYKCKVCYGIYVGEDYLPDNTSEKERYELHTDDASDSGYRKFVSPITSAIMNDFSSSNQGLDFGAGTSAIISAILKESNYTICNYDPYFHKYPELLEERYDYISSCEVIEHFYNPYKEFKLLKSMLKSGAKLYLMTAVYNESIDFASWYYKNDATHVFFYSYETFTWIKKEFGFSALEVNKKLVILDN